MASERNEYPDIYFEPAYAKLYETDDAEAKEYRFENPDGIITNLFLKRRINLLPEEGGRYYDLITPYGYGGPVIRMLHDPAKKEALIAAYMEDFGQYALKENIVSEFVRFHPIIGNGKDFRDAYASIYDRKTVGTNLTYEDVIRTEFSKHKRKDIKKILSDGRIRYRIDEDPETLDDFIEIYYSTMDRDGAGDYYYFGKDYFDGLLKAFPKNIITGKVTFEDKLIAMGVYFRYGRFMHAHLSGTLTEYLEYSPAYILKYALALYGHEKGYEVIHYGGGSSNDPENGLYKFKRDFGKNTQFDFYIAKKIWNPEVYEKMCAAAGISADTDFFPAYRKKR